MALWPLFWGMMQKPSFGGVVLDVVLVMVPLWIAVVVGVLVGWSWKPNWANLYDNSLLNLKAQAPAGAADNESENSGKSRSFVSIPSFTGLKLQLPSCMSRSADDVKGENSLATTGDIVSSEVENDVSTKLSDKDLDYLHRLAEEKDGGPAWIQMMDRSTKTMSYQAWRRDTENGPPQYRSRTVFDDATPEMVRDFFWDDNFRAKWDDMLIHASTLEECPTTGTVLVKWVRKFPFFCSDREYVIGRRIWESGRTYYCVTKGVPCSTVPRCNKPRRVDLYYSSWCIRPVESRSGDGQLSACEVLLFHYEDMGIPWEIAKLGVRQGMWGAVKKIDPGLRAYQKERAAGMQLSRSAQMAHITTKVDEDYLRCLGNNTPLEVSETAKESPEKPSGRNLPKLLVVGVAVVVACSLDRGLLTKALIFGVARRFANLGRRL